jgi:integrase
MGKDLTGKELGTGIKQRNDGRYEGRYVDRFGNRKSIYSASLRELKTRLKNLQAEDILEISIKKDLTVNEWYKMWMDEYKCAPIRVSTRTYYRQIYESKIKDAIGSKKLTDIQQIDVRRLLRGLKDQNSSFEICDKVKAILNDMYDKAILNHYAKENPAKGIKLIRDEKSDPKVLTVEEQKAFFTCCAGTFYDNAYTVQVNTGLRPGELFSLRESDIDFIKKTIHVTRTLTYYKFEELGDTKKEFHFGPPKTKSSIRDIPINKQCEIALKKQILQKKVVEETTCKEVAPQFADLLFTTKYNMPLNVQTYVDSIKRIVNEINLTRFPLDYMEPFSGHTFRHTFATRCFEAGIKPKTVQKFLGHSDLSMTMNLYTHVLESFKVSQMDLLDEFNDNVLNSEESYPFKIIRGNMESGNKVSKNIV